MLSRQSGWINMAQSFFRLAVIVSISCPLVISLRQKHLFNSDCSDANFKNVVCTVQQVDCNAEGDLIPKIKRNSTAIPGEAHDLRIEPFAKANARPNGEDYHLAVDISWQTPPENATEHLSGFLLEIEHENGLEQTCFFFDVSETNWTNQVIMSSPRFHFSIDSVFKFDQKYDVTLTSLPEARGDTSEIRKTVTMPENPGKGGKNIHVAENCTRHSHPYASKWTAGFRKVLVHKLARTIQIEFVGAPKQYCFEQYELRLLDEGEVEHVASAIISVDQMKTEVINNMTVSFGEYNFTDLEQDKTYIPSVIPVEKASDGRCLCPVGGTNPYDNKICGCIAAKGQAVNLTQITLETKNCENCKNITVGNAEAEEQADSSYVEYVVFIIFGLIILVVLAYIGVCFYNKYNASGKMINIRLELSERSGDNKHLFARTNGDARKPLIPNANVNILIIYSHDGPLHDAAVLAFAEYLRNVFHFDVHIDKWDHAAIEQNITDYISSSFLKANTVIIVNSAGAYRRYHSKVLNEGTVVRRRNPVLFDELFLAQISQALIHPSVMSVRFSCTPLSDVIPSLSVRIQYSIPDTLTDFLTGIAGYSLHSDGRIAAYSIYYDALVNAVNKLTAEYRNNPRWLDESHVSVAVSPPSPPGRDFATDADKQPLINNEVTSEGVTPSLQQPIEAPVRVEIVDEPEPDDSTTLSSQPPTTTTTLEAEDKEKSYIEPSVAVAAATSNTVDVQPPEDTIYTNTLDTVDSMMKTSPMPTSETTTTTSPMPVAYSNPAANIPLQTQPVPAHSAFQGKLALLESDADDSGLFSDADLRLVSST